MLLQKIYPHSKIFVEVWDSNGDFEACKNRADKYVEKLFSEICDMEQEEQRNLILIGHSFGGRIAVKTVARLKSKNICISIKIPLSSTCNDDEEKRKIMISVMTSKSKDWEYEKEWRLISKLSALNNNLYLIPFNSTIILSVFLGLNISEEDRKDITDLLKMIPEVRNISFFQMPPSHDKFELTANKIELA